MTAEKAKELFAKLRGVLEETAAAGGGDDDAGGGGGAECAVCLEALEEEKVLTVLGTSL
jgi:hypothetical protein